LCTTRQVANDFNAIEKELGLKPSTLLCTGNALNFEEFPFNPETPKQFDAVLLGRLHAHKGVLDAPAIWQQVRLQRPAARLVIIGEGPHRAALEAEFARIGLGPETGAVEFTGGVSDSVKNERVSQSRVGLSLSREEGWGLSITEFMAAGLPVVAMELPVFSEVFPGHLDLVPMADKQRTAERILHWLNQPELTRKQGEENRRFIQRYDARNLAQVEIDAMKTAVAAKRPPTVEAASRRFPNNTPK
jgi:glycosyltransferase involved in cell wall biosynthesis